MRPKRNSSKTDRKLTDLVWRTYGIPETFRNQELEVIFLENAILLKDSSGEEYYFQRKEFHPPNESKQSLPEVSEKVLQLRKLLEPWKKKARNITKPV